MFQCSAKHEQDALFHYFQMYEQSQVLVLGGKCQSAEVEEAEVVLDVVGGQTDLAPQVNVY